MTNVCTSHPRMFLYDSAVDPIFSYLSSSLSLRVREPSATIVATTENYKNTRPYAKNLTKRSQFARTHSLTKSNIKFLKSLGLVVLTPHHHHAE